MVFLGAEVMEIDSELRVKKRPAFPLSLCLTYYSIDEMCLSPCLKSMYPFKEVHSVLSFRTSPAKESGDGVLTFWYCRTDSIVVYGAATTKTL